MPVSLRPDTARRLVFWGAIALLVVAAYAAFGFYGVPALIRSQGAAFVTAEVPANIAAG